MEKNKIMVVEDETIIAAELAQHLEDFGYEAIFPITSGEEAIKRVEKDNPDLVLMDIVLKGEMDGVEAARRIREKWKTPVVFLSAFGSDEIMERAKGAEPYGYLKKPFRITDIRSTVEMALYKGKMEEERRALSQRLMKALAEIKTLRGLLPICANCKDIRDGEGKWHQMEVYVRDRTEAEFSHTLCPKCMPKFYPMPDENEQE